MQRTHLLAAAGCGVAAWVLFQVYEKNSISKSQQSPKENDNEHTAEIKDHDRAEPEETTTCADKAPIGDIEVQSGSSLSSASVSEIGHPFDDVRLSDDDGVVSGASDVAAGGDQDDGVNEGGVDGVNDEGGGEVEESKVDEAESEEGEGEEEDEDDQDSAHASMMRAARNGDVEGMQKFVDAAVAEAVVEATAGDAETDGTTAGTDTAATAKEVVNGPRDSDGATALLLASQNGHCGVVKLLLGLGADPRHVSVASSGGEHPLLLAANQGHVEVVKLLIDADAARADSVVDHGNDSDDDNEGTTKLVDLADFDNATSLLLACQNGHLEVVDLLLSAGAQVGLKMEGGRCALLLASQRGHDLVVERLLKEIGVVAEMPVADDGDDQDCGGGDDGAAGGDGGSGGGSGSGGGGGVKSLKTAAAALTEEKEEAAMEFVNAADDDGLTPLFAAAHQGHTSVAVRLLLAGANPAASKYLGFSPESIARAMGHEKCSQAIKMMATTGI